MSVFFLVFVSNNYLSTIINAEKTFAEPPVRITWYWNNSNVQLPLDSYICKRVKEDLNIEYVHISPKGTDFEEKLDILIASNEVPDIITSYNTLTSNLIRQGLVQPIEKYMNNTYIPNVIRIQNNWEKAKKYLKREDGHIYAIPNCYNDITAEVPFIRYDWLKNLGLEVPNNFEQLTNVLYQFTHNDPDGNGKDDTIGTNVNEYWGMVLFALNFGADAFEWYKGDDGLVTLGMFHPRCIEFIKYTKELIKKGCMDRNIATNTLPQIKNELFLGNVGFQYQWFDHTEADEIRKLNPEADWRPIYPPTGVYDKGYMPSMNIISEEYCISSKCKNIEDVLKLMNYMADDKSTDEKMDYSGSYWTMKYGERGVNWDILDNGLIDEGYSGNTAIAERNKIDTWVILARRFASKYDFAWRLALPKDVQEMYLEIDKYPLKISIPDDDKKRPINIEAISVPFEVAEFCEEWQYQRWPDFFYNCILGESDVEESWRQFLNEAKAAGLDNINKSMTEVLKEANILVSN